MLICAAAEYIQNISQLLALPFQLLTVSVIQVNLNFQIAS